MLTRESYRKIKTMNREAMNKYMLDVYVDGLEEGIKANINYNLKKVYDEVLTVKGIGPKRAKEVQKIIARAFEGFDCGKAREMKFTMEDLIVSYNNSEH